MKTPSHIHDTLSQPTLWMLMDDLRRLQGNVMEWMGLNPRTSASRTVCRWRLARLLAYQAPNSEQPVLLAIPAPIKTAYIWDLAPGISVVERVRSAGFQVYLVEWQRPARGDETTGLEEYAERTILACIREISAETGLPKIFLAGHSLGGTLAAIFASVHPDKLLGLIELEGPIEFDSRTGTLEAAVARSPPAAVITDALGNVPGFFLDLAGVCSDSETFRIEPWTDWLNSATSPRSAHVYGCVRRWTLDELPMPRRLFEEIVDSLYRENRFTTGTLTVDGHRADPRAIDVPILAVFNPRSRIVPIASAETYRRRTGSKDVSIFEYEGDTGIMLQHVGLLVGANARKTLWPRILSWMRRRSLVSVRPKKNGAK